MADKTGIEWTDATWNPIVGCSIVSKGCTNCYAMQVAHRMEAIADAKWDGTVPHQYRALTQPSKAGPVWTGRVNIAPDHILTQPLRWTRPRRIFVNSMSDLFHENVSDEWIDKIFAIMALTPQHTYQILTKRPERMAEYCREYTRENRGINRFFKDLLFPLMKRSGESTGMQHARTDDAILKVYDKNPWGVINHIDGSTEYKPLKNVWLGASVEDQETANERIPLLLNTPAAVRFISCEPLLDSVDLENIEPSGTDGGLSALTPITWQQHYDDCWKGTGKTEEESLDDFFDWYDLDAIPAGNMVNTIDWVIVGGESGKNARPMHPDWVRDIRDQCAAAGVPFFFKQWGEWAPGECEKGYSLRTLQTAYIFNDEWQFDRITPKEADTLHRDDEPALYRFGKRNVYNCLDGIYHDAYPEKKSC